MDNGNIRTPSDNLAGQGGQAESDQPKRSPECDGVVPRVQSKLMRIRHAHHDTKYLEDLRNQMNNTFKILMVRVMGAWEKTQ